MARRKLIELTWPGEPMDDVTSGNRLKVSISSLRRLGLPIDSAAEGFRIAAGVAVVHDEKPD
jgi:hypothetical protein